MSKNSNIPTITNLVFAGNPRLKTRANVSGKGSFDVEGLNMRINEIENAIGQDKPKPVGRAFAIRAEDSQHPKTKKKSNSHKESL